MYRKVEQILSAMFGECLYDANKIFVTYLQNMNKMVEWLSVEHKLDTYKTKFTTIQSKYITLTV